MKKIISVICAVVLLLSSVSVSAFALTKTEAEKEVTKQKALYEGAFSQKIAAADARNVLKTSAGLKISGVDTKYFDIDDDGKITAIDARIFLRIAAKLDSINNYYGKFVYNYFLAIINSIKPGEHQYYSAKTDETKDVRYNDPSNVVGQINGQMKIFESLDPELANFNFENEIKSSVGNKKTSYSTNGYDLTNDDYPVKGNELACLLNFSEINSVKYENNQTFTFKKVSELTGKVLIDKKIEGLDAITVYLKDETVSLTGDISGRFDNLTVNKAFDALSESDVKKMIADNASAGNLEGMDQLGKCDVKINPKNLKYKDSYIKIYFYPETGVPVGTVHNLGYVMNMDMTMDVDITLDSIAGDQDEIKALLIAALGLEVFLKLVQNGGKLFYVNGTMNIENILNTETRFFLCDTVT